MKKKSSLRNWARAFVLAALPALASCANTEVPKPVKKPTDIVQTIPQKQTIQEEKLELYRLIEREMQKQDPWVEKWIQQDYTINKLPRQTSLLITPAQDDENKNFVESLGSYIASFDPHKNKLELSSNKNIEEVIDAVDHELWHTVFDNAGEKGLFHSIDFQGPSLEEFRKYTLEKVKGKDYEKIHEVLKRAELYLNLIPAGEELEFFREYSDKIDFNISDFKLDLESYKEMNFTEQNVSSFEKKIHNLENINKEFKKKVVKYDEWLKSFVNSLPEDPMKTEIKFLEEEVKQQQSLQKQIINLKMSFQKADKEMVTLAFEYDKKYIAQLAEEIDILEDKLKKIRGDNWSSKDWHKTVREINRIGDIKDRFSFAVLSRKISRMSQAMKLAINTNKKSYRDTVTSKLYEIVKNPDEIMARMVDAMYSLHFGPVEQNKFPLSEKDLEWMSQFKYKGELLFRKGIEKYSLGLKMIKDGVDPNKVKEQLEYATSFEYKGTKFEWGISEWNLKGKIPVSTE